MKNGNELISEFLKRTNELAGLIGEEGRHLIDSLTDDLYSNSNLSDPTFIGIGDLITNELNESKEAKELKERFSSEKINPKFKGAINKDYISKRGFAASFFNIESYSEKVIKEINEELEKLKNDNAIKPFLEDLNKFLCEHFFSDTDDKDRKKGFDISSLVKDKEKKISLEERWIIRLTILENLPKKLSDFIISELNKFVVKVENNKKATSIDKKTSDKIKILIPLYRDYFYRLINLFKYFTNKVIKKMTDELSSSNESKRETIEKISGIILDTWSVKQKKVSEKHEKEISDSNKKIKESYESRIEITELALEEKRNEVFSLGKELLEKENNREENPLLSKLEEVSNKEKKLHQKEVKYLKEIGTLIQKLDDSNRKAEKHQEDLENEKSENLKLKNFIHELEVVCQERKQKLDCREEEIGKIKLDNIRIKKQSDRLKEKYNQLENKFEQKSNSFFSSWWPSDPIKRWSLIAAITVGFLLIIYNTKRKGKKNSTEPAKKQKEIS